MGRAVAPPSEQLEPAPPVAVPQPGGSGCVESTALKEFVLALEAERQRARAGALAGLGGQALEHPSVFEDPVSGLHVGQMYERNGQRYAVVAQLASREPPRVTLLEQGDSLHPLEERPRAHAVALRVCGVNACPAERAPVLPALRLLAVPLAPELKLGPPVRLSYDFWWAQVSYDRERKCPAAERAAQRAGTE